MNKSTDNRFAEQLRLLPTTPGVYKFLDREGTIIYVGKAKNLRRRVSSYFVNSQGHSAKVRVLVSRIASIQHIVVPTETDALLLENSLIKTLQPHYNILLKDDKTYPWIKVCNEPFPRIISTRRLIRDGSLYFGPYGSGMLQKSVLELIHGLYPLRTCRLNLSEEAIAKARYRPCLKFHIGSCKAPCAAMQSHEEYQAYIDLSVKILRGELRTARNYLEEQMRFEAEKMRFEAAAIYKSRLDMLENYASHSVIVSPSLGDMDIFYLLTDEDDQTAYCNFVRVAGGTVVNSFTVRLSRGIEDDPKSLLTEAISQISVRYANPLAREIIVPFKPHEELFEGHRFTVPSKGDKQKLLEFAARNARMFRLERLKNMEIKNPERHTDRLMESMRKALHMDSQPRHIECFDNSNIQGEFPVASCVVFRDGKPSRSEYRHFNIKTVVGPDDFASMREIIFRRYTRLLAEESPLPDLIVVDGGKGQLSSAYAILQQIGIADKVTIIGLAKRIEEVFFPNDPEPYYLERTGEPLKVIMHIRDEAHRFGITFHRNKRSAAFIGSELEQIEGVGKKSSEKLLSQFRSVAGLRKASLQQIAESIGAARAEKIYRHLHPETEN